MRLPSPRSSRGRTACAAAAYALAAFLLAGCGDRPARTGANARDSLELHALVDSLLPQLGRLASLPPRGPVRSAFRSNEQVRRFLESRLDEEMPPALIAELKSIYSLLGLVPDTLDLRRLLLDLYTEQIVGYYDPHARTMYVVEGVAPESVVPVLAHELVHALQDQHANLDSLIARDRGNDRQTAAHAAIEGHATVVMFAFLAEQASGRPVDPATLPNPATELAAGLKAQNEQFPVFRTAPAIIREAVLFPYIGGAEFVHQLWRAEPARRPAPLGDWLPQSTEQVLHPAERFLARRDEPTTLPPPPAPPGWRATGTPDQLGELETSIFLAEHLGENARADARGWDGDRYQLLADQQGRKALVWISVWDDERAADRFADAVRRIARSTRERALAVRRATHGQQPAVVVDIFP